MEVTRQTLFALTFYEKMKFNGSKGKMNYRIEKTNGEKEACLRLTIWEGPERYDVSEAEKKIREYPFSEEGMNEIVEFLNKEL